MYDSFQIESYVFYCNPVGFFKMFLELAAFAMLSVQNL